MVWISQKETKQHWESELCVSARDIFPPLLAHTLPGLQPCMKPKSLWSETSFPSLYGIYPPALLIPGPAASLGPFAGLS